MKTGWDSQEATKRYRFSPDEWAIEQENLQDGHVIAEGMNYRGRVGLSHGDSLLRSHSDALDLANRD